MPRERLPALDGLRGVAVMGIVLMNVTSFALPSGAYFNPTAWGTPSSADLVAWAFAAVFVDGKMRALFSILFGASMAILAARAEDDEGGGHSAHLRRMAALAAIGLAHGVLLWPGDILLHYALVGCLAWPLIGVGARDQIRVAAALFVGQALLEAMVLAGDLQVRAQGGAAWRAMAAAIGVGPADAMRADIATHLGSWPALVADNAREMVAGVPFTLAFNGLETMGLMALGMAALSSGLWQGGWDARRRRWLAAAGLGTGLPLAALLAWAVARSGFDTIATFAAATLGGVALRPLVAMGYAACALTWLAQPGAVRARIRAAGRMTLSNYLATSLVLSVVFDGWGLGLFARASRIEAYAVAPLVWLAMLAWSRPWLARFRYGPAEWLWRSMAEGRRLPLRRNPAIATG